MSFIQLPRMDVKLMVYELIEILEIHYYKAFVDHPKVD